MKILAVEDDKQKIKRILRAFHKNGIEEYEVAENMEEALKKATKIKFDLLVLDIVFPQNADGLVKKNQKMGLEMMLYLAKQNIRIPTIVYSFSPLSKADLEALEKVKYPFIMQLMDDILLERKIQELLS